MRPRTRRAPAGSRYDAIGRQQGDRDDTTVIETIHSLCKAELVPRRAPRKSRHAVERAWPKQVAGFNHHRLLESIGPVPPAEAEAEANDSLQLTRQPAIVVARRKPNRRRQTRSDSVSVAATRLQHQPLQTNTFASSPPMKDLATRIRECSKLQGRFILRSGAISDMYFDKYRFEADPGLLKDIATAMAVLIPADTDVLAGLEMGGIPVVTMLSQVTGLPATFIRKAPKSYGTCQYAEGTPLQGRRFVLVEDVVSSGGAILDAVQMLASDGLSPLAALCVIDRETGGAEALAKAGLELRSVFTYTAVAGA